MSLRPYVRRFGKVVITAGLIVAVSIAGVFASRTLFIIRSIEVVGSGVTVALDRKRFPDNLLFFPIAKMREELLSDNQLLEDVEFTKRYPGTLIIRPILRKPIAVLELPDRTLLLARTGAVVGVAGVGGDLPVIAIESNSYTVGSIITDQRITAALSFIGTVGSFLEIDRITSVDALSIRAKSKETDIIITQNSDMAIVAATLQTMMTGFRIKGTLPHTIDLRFRKPVVTF